MGLRLYDFLAGSRDGIQPHRSFNRAEFARRFPFLDTANLVGGFDYGDAQTDDARLVLEIIDGAASAGAVCLNYFQVTGFIENNGRICAADVQDLVSGEILRVQASQVVNTTGQWVTDSRKPEQWCRLSKGVHLVLPGVLGDEALLLTAQSDGRVFFMMSWYGQTLLGTTDTDYSGDVNQVEVKEEDVDYLLTEANRVLDRVRWTKKDIIGQFAGLRVLKLADNKAISNISRDWELKILDTGLLVSIGGKLTSARKDAAHIVDTVCKNLGVVTSCQTQGRKFPWAPEQNYAKWSAAALAEAEKLGVDQESAFWLLRRHGKRVSGIFRLIEKDRHQANRIVASNPFVLADLRFCAEHEMVVRLEDLLRRRLPLLITSRLNREELTHLAKIAAGTLGWDEVVLEKEIQLCEKKWQRL